MPLPVVAIVGRPNVGKSSLLNALARRRVAIVQDEPGVTRDRVGIPLNVRGRWVELVDTGGYGFEDQQGLTDHIREQIEHALGRASLALFIVDAHAGPQDPDRTITKLLRENNVPTAVLANKTDGPSYEAGVADFASLGLGTPLGVSATTGHNLDGIIKIISDRVDLSNAPTELPPPDLHVAIVGKRNAGKSTIVNAISGLYEDDPDRVIVSEVAGTTRDSVDVRVEKDGRALVVIDTAGIRKKRHMVNDDVEFYSFHRAQRSIRRADVVVHLLDSLDTVSQPDKKLAQYVEEQAKPCILVLNKWDLALAARQKQLRPDQAIDDRALVESYEKYVRDELPGQRHAPLLLTSAIDARKIQAVLDACQRLFKQSSTRVGTGELNRALEQVMGERAPKGGRGGGRPRVYYATQVASNPPTIILFVNHADVFDDSYKRFIVNRFRELLPFKDVPIKLEVRQRENEERKEQIAKSRPRLHKLNFGAKAQPAKAAKRKPGKPRAERK